MGQTKLIFIGRSRDTAYKNLRRMAENGPFWTRQRATQPVTYFRPFTQSIVQGRQTLPMEKQNAVRLALEVTWWVITAVVVWAVLTPINNAMYLWPFRTWNIIFIVSVVTFVRLIFFLKYTFLAKWQIVKIILLLLMFPATFMYINGISDFMTYIEEKTWDPLTGHLSSIEKLSTEQYIWHEMLFFGVGSVLSAPAFAVRMMLSIWRTRNRGTV